MKMHEYSQMKRMEMEIEALGRKQLRLLSYVEDKRVEYFKSYKPFPWWCETIRRKEELYVMMDQVDRWRRHEYQIREDLEIEKQLCLKLEAKQQVVLKIQAKLQKEQQAVIEVKKMMHQVEVGGKQTRATVEAAKSEAHILQQQATGQLQPIAIAQHQVLEVEKQLNQAAWELKQQQENQQLWQGELILWDIRELFVIGPSNNGYEAFLEGLYKLFVDETTPESGSLSLNEETVKVFDNIHEEVRIQQVMLGCDVGILTPHKLLIEISNAKIWSKFEVILLSIDLHSQIIANQYFGRISWPTGIGTQYIEFEFDAQIGDINILELWDECELIIDQECCYLILSSILSCRYQNVWVKNIIWGMERIINGHKKEEMENQCCDIEKGESQYIQVCTAKYGQMKEAKMSHNIIIRFLVDFRNMVLKLVIDSLDSFITQSRFGNKLGRKDSLVVSTACAFREAIWRVARYPEKVYSLIWDMVGRPYKHVKGFLDTVYIPFNVVEDPRGAASVKIDDGVTVYSVEELLAMILSYAGNLADFHSKVHVKDAMISVPPYFGLAERKGLLQAAQLDGINMLSLSNEHSGATLQCGIDKDFSNGSRRVIFYNMGVTSTYASLVYFSAYNANEYGKTVPVKQFQVMEDRWNSELGGQYMELCLVEYLTDEFNKQVGNGVEVRKSPEAMAKLKQQVKRTKEFLSANTQAPMSVESFYDNRDFRSSITCEKFEELCGDLWEKSLTPLKEMLGNSGLKLDDICAVEWIGGATRVPKIQDLLHKPFEHEMDVEENKLILKDMFFYGESSELIKERVIIIHLDVTVYEFKNIGEIVKVSKENPVEVVVWCFSMDRKKRRNNMVSWKAILSGYVQMYKDEDEVRREKVTYGGTTWSPNQQMAYASEWDVPTQQMEMTYSLECLGEMVKGQQQCYNSRCWLATIIFTVKIYVEKWSSDSKLKGSKFGDQFGSKLEDKLYLRGMVCHDFKYFLKGSNWKELGRRRLKGMGSITAWVALSLYGVVSTLIFFSTQWSQMKTRECGWVVPNRERMKRRWRQLELASTPDGGGTIRVLRIVYIVCCCFIFGIEFAGMF